MNLDRDADEDCDIAGYASEGAEEARGIMSGDVAKVRGRDNTTKDRTKALDRQFASAFSEMKELANTLHKPPAPPPPRDPDANKRPDALLKMGGNLVSVATMYLQSKMQPPQ